MTMHIQASHPRSKRVTAARAAAWRTKLPSAEEGTALVPAVPPPLKTAAGPIRGPVMPIDLAIEQLLQDLVGGNRSPKTIEWHQTALRFLHQYLVSEHHVLDVTQLTATQISGWLSWLRQTPGARGKPRTASTLATYARSARAFCNWLGKCAYLECTPFETVTFPKVDKPRI